MLEISGRMEFFNAMKMSYCAIIGTNQMTQSSVALGFVLSHYILGLPYCRTPIYVFPVSFVARSALN